jgi:hypothetical protein
MCFCWLSSFGQVDSSERPTRTEFIAGYTLSRLSPAAVNVLEVNTLNSGITVGWNCFLGHRLEMGLSFSTIFLYQPNKHAIDSMNAVYYDLYEGYGRPLKVSQIMTNLAYAKRFGRYRLKGFGGAGIDLFNSGILYHASRSFPGRYQAADIKGTVSLMYTVGAQAEYLFSPHWGVYLQGSWSSDIPLNSGRYMVGDVEYTNETFRKVSFLQAGIGISYRINDP